MTDRRPPRAALARAAFLVPGIAVTIAGARSVPAWGDVLLVLGFGLCLAGGIRLFRGRSLVVEFGCGPFVGASLFFAVFVIAETPDAAARRAGGVIVRTQSGQE